MPPEKLIPFPARSVRAYAKRLLRLSASRAKLDKPKGWHNRPVPPESVGNMLQHLATRDPYAVLVLENIIAEMLTQLDRP